MHRSKEQSKKILELQNIAASALNIFIFINYESIFKRQNSDEMLLLI